MEKLKIVIKKYWKIYLAALVISAVCDLIGTVKLNIGVGTLTLFRWCLPSYSEAFRAGYF